MSFVATRVLEQEVRFPLGAIKAKAESEQISTACTASRKEL